MFINFTIIHLTPGGPIEQISMDLHAENSLIKNAGKWQNQELDEETIEILRRDFSFDKPLLVRFFIMIKRYACFDFGRSYFNGEPVLELISSRLPVSCILGLFSLIIIIMIAIPLGIFKAVYDGSLFDIITTSILAICSGIPGFVFGIGLLLVFSIYLDAYPIRGLVGENYNNLNHFERILDILHHITLPVTSIVLSNLSKPAILIKNSFLEELDKGYILAAQSKGASFARILWKDCFKNAILPLFTGLPNMFLTIFFFTSFLIEFLFSLEGIGALIFEATLNRDYPIVLASVYLTTFLGVTLHLIFDLIYKLIDPRIDLMENRS